jgi:hypothetical protein
MSKNLFPVSLLLKYVNKYCIGDSFKCLIWPTVDYTV